MTVGKWPQYNRGAAKAWADGEAQYIPVEVLAFYFQALLDSASSTEVVDNGDGSYTYKWHFEPVQRDEES